MMLEVAFANEAHARRALAVMNARHDLFQTVSAHRPVFPADMVIVDLRLEPRNRTPLMSLVQGLHGIVIRDHI